MKLVPNAITSAVGRKLLAGREGSPKALFAIGLVGMGATVVLACRATLQVERVIDKVEEAHNDIDEALNNRTASYSEKDAKKDRMHVYARAGLELGQLYGPAVLCGALSVAALAGSHHILSKRNAGLIAAYGALEKTFAEYRERVSERYGREEENEIYHDIRPCEIEDPETGKKKTVKKANVGGSPYARLFGPEVSSFEHNPEMNFAFLKLQQNYCNQLLQSRGHLFLNEVYDLLGFERTPAGQVVGWVKGNGDDYVDFGIFNEGREEQVLDFMVGREDSIWLDFNVDGTVYKKI